MCFSPWRCWCKNRRQMLMSVFLFQSPSYSKNFRSPVFFFTSLLFDHDSSFELCVCFIFLKLKLFYWNLPIGLGVYFFTHIDSSWQHVSFFFLFLFYFVFYIYFYLTLAYEFLIQRVEFFLLCFSIYILIFFCFDFQTEYFGCR